MNDELLIHRLLEGRELHPERPAMVFGGTQLSYLELAQKVTELAAGLSAWGLLQGDRVLVMLGNGIEFATLYFAAADLGLVLVPVSPSYSSMALENAARAAEAVALIGWHGSLGGVLREEGAVFHAIPPERWISVGGELGRGMSWSQMLAKGRADYRLGENEVDAHAPYILTMTSGSTGEPKPIVLSQATKLRRSLSARDCYGLGKDEVILAATPMYHSLAMRMVILPIVLGGTAVIMQRFTAASWIQHVRENGVTFCMLVSSQLEMILDTLPSGSNDLATLRCVVSSSALLRRDVKARLISELRCRVHECYGASEVGVVTDLSFTAGADKENSVGRPVPGVEVRIESPENGEVLAAGQRGEIVCRSAMCCGGYSGGAAAAWVNACREGWFHTGDIGALDADGYLYFHGRLKEIIITGGINVYPKDVESCLNSCPGVRQSAVIGIDDSRLGEVVFAVVVPEVPGTVTEREMRRFAAGRLADFQQPMGYALVDELPLNAMGKIDKRALTQRFQQQGAGQQVSNILGGSK